MTDVFRDAVELVKTTYGPKVIIGYGSFVNGTPNKESDIDIIALAEIEEMVHDSRMMDAHQLDAWIHPMRKVLEVDDILHVWPGELVLDHEGIGARMLAAIEARRREKAKRIEGTQREVVDSWIPNMLKRASGEGLEAKYRYLWLLHDFPEIYCNYHGIYFDGPIKTIRYLRENDLRAYERYAKAIDDFGAIGDLIALYSEVK